MSAAERAPYEDIAAARQATFRGSKEEANPETLAAESAGEWGIGQGPKPLSDEHIQEPACTLEFRKKVAQWAVLHGDVIMHVPQTLPYKNTVYREACKPGLCRRSACYGKADSLSNRWRSLVSKDPIGSAYLLFSKGCQGPMPSRDGASEFDILNIFLSSFERPFASTPNPL